MLFRSPKTHINQINKDQTQRTNIKISKGKTTNNTQGDSYKNNLLSKALTQIQQRNQKLYRQAKAKRIQHHQTSFATNVKGTSLGRRERATTRNKKTTNGKPH